MAKKKQEAKDRADTKHPDYDKLKAKRDVVRAVIGGVDELLAKPDAYLPQYEGETQQSYDLRKQSATLNKYTKKAVKVLAGMVFAGPIAFDKTPQQIVDLSENFDKEGNHINVVARTSFEENVLIDGYGGIVVDTPSTVVRNKKEQARLDLNPFARIYYADAIWNWREGVDPVTKDKRLEMLVLRDDVQEPSGRFETEEAIYYRAYELTAAGVTLETFKVEAKTGELISQGAIKINTSRIPVPIAGELGAEPPLYDIARKNVEHFQTYSLMKSDAHKTCVPQRVIEGGSADSIAPIAGDVTLFPGTGSNGQFGKAYFIEVAGASLEFVRNLCKDIATDIASMTNSIIAGKQEGPDVTATGEIIDNTQETAELRPMAEGFKDTLERVLGFMAELMNKGVDAGGEVVLGTQWAIAEQKQEENAKRQVLADEANIEKTKAEAASKLNGK